MTLYGQFLYGQTRSCPYTLSMAKGKRLEIRLTDAELAKCKREADQGGLDLSAWVRVRLFGVLPSLGVGKVMKPKMAILDAMVDEVAVLANPPRSLKRCANCIRKGVTSPCPACPCYKGSK